MLLYGIYKEYALFDKAIDLTHRMYATSHDPKWLAEEAILIYEQADHEHHVTPEVLARMGKLFVRAFAEGARTPVYLNYYGYTLIDHDIQIDKGIGMVRRALGKDPNNLYYLDSLAWGLYKKGECKSAYRLMQRVVRKEIGREPEIQDHYRAIKACLKRR
jgi:tetratricopeptide (TPR) repeat protein